MTCLTSFKTREALRNMAKTDPDFWAELTKDPSNSDDEFQLPDIAETLPEDIEHDTKLEDQDADDSDLSMQTLITALTKDIPETVGSRKTGALTSLTDAENSDLGLEMLLPAEANVKPEKEGAPGRRKRKKFANKQYQAFWRHHDDDDWKDDSVLPTVG